MRLIFYLTCFLSISKICLCSDVDVKGSATAKPGVLKKVKDEVIESLKEKRDRFREWLKWDAECNFLRPEEREIRVAKGRCPPLPSTLPPSNATTKDSFWRRRRRQKGLPRTSIFAHDSKKKFITAITLGQQSVDEVDVTRDHASYRFITGTMLVLSCDQEARNVNETSSKEAETAVTWYVNTNLVETGLLDWRVTVTPSGQLSIWPLLQADSGSFECAVGATYQASATIEVITRKEALLEGFLNYLLVGLFYIPVAAFAVFLISRSSLEPPRKNEREDRMAAFLEEHVMKNGDEAKENIARVVYGDDFERKKAEIERSVRSGRSVSGTNVRGNVDTIRTILMPDQDLVPSGVVTSNNLRRRTKKNKKAAEKT